MDMKRNILEGRDERGIMKYIEGELSLVEARTNYSVSRRPLFFSRSKPDSELGPAEWEWGLADRRSKGGVLEHDYVVRFRPDLDAFEITHSNSDAGPFPMVGTRSRPEIGTVLPVSAVLGQSFNALTEGDRKWLALHPLKEDNREYPARIRYPVSLAIFVCGIIQICDPNTGGLS